jgi:hypothetical protein
MSSRLTRPLFGAALCMLATFIVFFIVQTVIYRLGIFTTMGINLFVVSGVIGAIAAVAAPKLLSRLISESHERWLVSILSALAFFGWTGIYLMIFPVSIERSFSVRLLVNLLNEQNNSMTKAQIEALHTREQIYDLRYTEMSRGGLVKVEGDRLTLLPSGKLIAGTYRLLGQSMGFPSGFNH